MPITLEANGKDIRVTGGTEGTPITWDDIVAADTSGGWGRITTLNANVPKQYTIATDTRVYIGDNGATPTYVAVERCEIVFNNGYFQINSGPTATNAVLRFGRPNTASYATSVTMRGISTENLVRLAGSGTWYIYSSSVTSCSILICGGINITARFSSIVCLADAYINPSIATLDLGQSVSSLIQTGVSTDFRFSDLQLVRLSSYAAPELALRDTVTTGLVLRTPTVGDSVLSLYDSPMPTSVVLTDIGGANPTIHSYSTLQLIVQDADGVPIEGAAITVRDVDSAVVYSATTDANGTHTAQDVLFREREVTASNTFNNTDHTPHTVTITAAGYLDRVMVLDMSSRHVDVETLTPSSAVVVYREQLTATIVNDAVTATITDDALTASVED